MRIHTNLLLVLFVLLSELFHSQNQARNWYFGNNAGLNFSTNPPTILNNGAMSTTFGCSSISSPAGNLLFYSNGVTVWDQTHSVMANGTGLTGSNSAQSCVIAKQPGNATLYYIFTVQGAGGPAGLNYSIVDMSLAGGNGSVTVKNATLLPVPLEEKITAVKHCNQTDIWVMVKEMSNTIFKAYLLTSAGVSTVAVSSSLGSSRTGPSERGSIKFSPNGKKMSEVWASTGGTPGVQSCSFTAMDFNNNTGVLSNFLCFAAFSGAFSNAWAYGTEFSPDGKVLYYIYHGYLFQWNHCIVPMNGNGGLGHEENQILTYNRASMQLAPNGKIYIAKAGSNTLDVINNPNLSGPACGYSLNALSVGNGTVQYGLPTFLTSYFEQMPGPFTYSSNLNPGCMLVAFFSPTVCAFTGYTITSTQWNFGDPGSGAANTSSLANPTHSFSAPGTYTVQLINSYACNKNDTLYQTISVGSPTFGILTPSLSCGPTNATLTVNGGVGPFSYTWSPTLQTGSVVSGMLPGMYSVVMSDNGSGCQGVFTVSIPSIVLTSSVITTPLPCHNLGTGTASLNVFGGSGTYSVSWSNTPANSTSLSGLNAGNYSVSVFDLVSGCTSTANFSINQPAPLVLSMVVLTPTVCAGNTVALYSGANGGNAPYAYQWSGGPANQNYTLSPQTTGQMVYTCSVIDANNCSASNTLAITIAPTPTLTVTGANVCPGAVALVSVSGANTYTWQPGTFAATSFTIIPNASLVYTVTGKTNGCSSSATAAVNLLSAPVAFASNNGPVCSGTALNLSGSGGQNYLWTGPSGFVSNSQNPFISSTSIANSGVYTLVVTAANTCTSSVTTMANIASTPSIGILGNTVVCIGQSTQLNASGANTYTWSTGSNNSFIVLSPAATAVYTVSGNFTQNQCVGTNTFMVKVVECIGLTEQNAASGSGVTIYPNPFSSVFSVETKQSVKLLLYSVSGSFLFEQEIEAGQHLIDLSPYAKGVYFMRIASNGYEETVKLVKTE